MPLQTNVNILTNHPGPLPISIDYAPLSDDSVTVFLSGSAYSEKANQFIGFQLKVNGTVVGESQVFSDTRKEHRATVPSVFSCNIPFKMSKDDLGNEQVDTVAIELVPLAGSDTNEHDLFNLAVID